MKRFLPLYIAVLLVLAAASRLAAQAAGTTPESDDLSDTLTRSSFYRRISYGVGMNASLYSGAGLSGRVMFPQGVGAQLSFFAISIGGYTHFNVGAEGQYSFIRKRDHRLYGVLGMSLYSSVERDDTTDRGNVVANPFRLGLGVGYEWFPGEDFAMHIAGALTYFPETKEFLPIPGIGFHFYFH